MVLEDRDVLFSCLVFIYFQLQWVFGAVRGLSPVAEHGLQSTWASGAAAFRLSRAGSIAVVHRLSRPAARGTVPAQG